MQQKDSFKFTKAIEILRKFSKLNKERPKLKNKISYKCYYIWQLSGKNQVHQGPLFLLWLFFFGQIKQFLGPKHSLNFAQNSRVEEIYIFTYCSFNKFRIKNHSNRETWWKLLSIIFHVAMRWMSMFWTDYNSTVHGRICTKIHMTL